MHISVQYNIIKIIIIREEIYNLLSCGLFPEEQKGFRKETRGTGKLQYIDQPVLKNSKMRWKNIAMAWIDYKKAYESSWPQGKTEGKWKER